MFLSRIKSDQPKWFIRKERLLNVYGIIICIAYIRNSTNIMLQFRRLFSEYSVQGYVRVEVILTFLTAGTSKTAAPTQSECKILKSVLSLRNQDIVKMWLFVLMS